MFSASQFSPEQSSALDRLSMALENPLQTQERVSLTLSSVTTKDSAFFTNSIVQTSDIPRQSEWLWNQSRGKQSVPCTNKDFSVYMSKLNTRKSHPSMKPPPQFKVWVFHIHWVDGKKQTFFWCEKGDPPSPLNQDLLSELSFLSSFVSFTCAKELGWTESGFSKLYIHLK